MNALSLKTFSEPLHKVEPDTQTPVTTICGWKEKLGDWYDEVVDNYGLGFEKSYYHRLSLEELVGFSFDEICKMRHSSSIMMSHNVDELFKNSDQHSIIRKIESSMWRWSSSRGSWNEVVDAYENLRSFSFLPTNPDFEVRLDWTTGYNEFGYSEYSRTYLDGVFGFLVYYKGQHLLTIGFSILDGSRVLVQQVQSAQRNGNRGLFKIPKNRVEFVLELFAWNFPGYKLFMIDGESLMQKTLNDYRNALKSNRESQAIYKDNPPYLEVLQGREKELLKRMEHLEADMRRISSTYKNIGHHSFGNEVLTACGLKHNLVLPKV